MSEATPKGVFWREVKYTEQWVAVQGRRDIVLRWFAYAPRQFTPAQIKRMRKISNRAKGKA